MEVVIRDDAEQIGDLVADVIVQLVARRRNAVLGLATGSTPLPTYRALIERYRNGDVSFAACRAVLLDEYLGLAPGHPQSYRTFIERELTHALDLPGDHLYAPPSDCDDVPAACRAYEKLIRDLGGVALQILGIGADGHIGFNEPMSSLRSRTRIKTLTERTREDNARFFASPEEVPRHVLTQGLATILDARHIVLIATGEHKATPIAAAVEGPVAARCPASVLQMHPHVTVLVDEEAASRLEQRDYYRETFEHKPEWQGL